MMIISMIVFVFVMTPITNMAVITIVTMIRVIEVVLIIVMMKIMMIVMIPSIMRSIPLAICVVFCGYFPLEIALRLLLMIAIIV